MVYDMIFENLLSIFGGGRPDWLVLGVEIFSFILTCIWIMIFLIVPTILFYRFLSLFTESNIKRRRRRKWE